MLEWRPGFSPPRFATACCGRALPNFIIIANLILWQQELVLRSQNNMERRGYNLLFAFSVSFRCGNGGWVVVRSEGVLVRAVCGMFVFGLSPVVRFC